jgi:hypothetical protein
MFGSNSKQTPSISTLRANSAEYGLVLACMRGTNRMAGRLLDWADFKAITHEASGGKGGGGGKGSMSSDTYQVACDIALAMGEGYVGIGLVFDGQGVYGKGTMIEEITIPSGNPGSYTPQVATEGNYSYDAGVSIITTEQVWVPAYDSGSSLPSGGGAAGVGDGYYETVDVYTPMRKVGGSNPGEGQYCVTGSGTNVKYLFNYADAGKSAKLSCGTTVNVVAEFTFFNGSRPQTAWAYMLGRYPARAVAYAGICHVAAESYQLGTSGTLDNIQFELMGPGIFGGGIMDAGIDSCLHMVLDDPDGGCGFPTNLIGDLTQAIAYCASQGIFFSPKCDTQRTAASYLDDWCAAANLAICWNSGLLQFIPYGDTPLAGNGYTFAPDMTPVYDLDDDDFIAEDDEPPLRVETEDIETLANWFEVDILDRTLGYNTHPIPDKDDALVWRFGRINASPIKADFICDPNVGAIVANIMRLRKTQVEILCITFKLGPQYELLEKMDIVTITNPEMGWVKKPFRLKEQQEDRETETMEWTAEPVVWGSCSATQYAKQAPGQTATQLDIAPGSILPPIIFEAPDSIVQTPGTYELWIGLCGATLATWGGCNVYDSSDGNTYKNETPEGFSGASRMGVLTADFPALSPVVAGLDAVNTLAVNLTESGGTLTSGTAADRDAFRTLCWVEAANGQFELISFETATLVTGSTNAYQITSIQRGVYGTPVLDHPAGMRFLRCDDDSILKLSFSAADVGTTAYLKATSYNIYKQGVEELSAVTAYSYSLQGLFNNSGQIVANNATVDYDSTTLTSSGVTIRAYGAVSNTPTPGTAITFLKADGNYFTCPALTLSGAALVTTYYAMLNRAADAPYWLTSYSAAITAIGHGHIMIGSVTTPSASGSGGSTGGGGGTSGGGGGGRGTGTGISEN